MVALAQYVVSIFNHVDPFFGKPQVDLQIRAESRFALRDRFYFDWLVPSGNLALRDRQTGMAQNFSHRSGSNPQYDPADPSCTCELHGSHRSFISEHASGHLYIFGDAAFLPFASPGRYPQRQTKSLIRLSPGWHDTSLKNFILMTTAIE